LLKFFIGIKNIFIRTKKLFNPITYNLLYLINYIISFLGFYYFIKNRIKKGNQNKKNIEKERKRIEKKKIRWRSWCSRRCDHRPHK
jgi:predicted membrane protein